MVDWQWQLGAAHKLEEPEWALGVGQGACRGGYGKLVGPWEFGSASSTLFLGVSKCIHDFHKQSFSFLQSSVFMYV